MTHITARTTGRAKIHQNIFTGEQGLNPMALIVQKYGGTSVGSIERIEAVAEKVIASKNQGHKVVVVFLP